jgi:hypothetical protein
MMDVHRHGSTRQHSGARAQQDRQVPLTDAEVKRASRAWEVNLMLEEMRDFGLRPPPGLTSALELFVDGAATVTAIQAYLDQQLSTPVSSLSLEVRHA